MIHNSKLNNKGFTLLELLLAISLLSLVITITIGIFVSGSKTQRKIIELSVVQREGGYLMETISRELRMATAIDVSQAGNIDSDIEFTNYNSDVIKYCRSFEDGVCDPDDVLPYSPGGNYLSRDGKRISSSDVIVEDLKFYVSDTFVNKQPLITIVMKIKSNNGNTNLMLQNSIALRIY
jgi:prepilin-type N-terminal cleavage/methylation domain-containing protein